MTVERAFRMPEPVNQEVKRRLFSVTLEHPALGEAAKTAEHLPGLRSNVGVP